MIVCNIEKTKHWKEISVRYKSVIYFLISFQYFFWLINRILWYNALQKHFLTQLISWKFTNLFFCSFSIMTQISFSIMAIILIRFSIKISSIIFQLVRGWPYFAWPFSPIRVGAKFNLFRAGGRSDSEPKLASFHRNIVFYRSKSIKI